MAKAPMQSTQQVVSTGVEILYKSHYEGEAITLDTTAFTNGVCKAGTPMAKDGKKAVTTAGTSGAADTTTAFGILLTDVYEARPQGTVVYMGTINEAVAKTNSGVTVDATMKAAMPRVTFM